MPKRVSIFEGEERTAPSNPYRDDVVGRLHGGYLNGRSPVSLDEWRFTTDDPEVADRIAELFGGEPQETGDGDNVLNEVFTPKKAVNIILESAEAIGTEFVLWGRDGKIAMRGDGVTIEGGEPDPGAHLELAERKDKAKQGLVPSPEITVYFRLADDPDLGIFRFIKRDAWGLERNLHRNGFYDQLDDAEGSILATIKRVPVEFVAKNGARAGKTVSYTETQIEFIKEITE